jgi:hypothetical protein
MNAQQNHIELKPNLLISFWEDGLFVYGHNLIENGDSLIIGPAKLIQDEHVVSIGQKMSNRVIKHEKQKGDKHAFLPKEVISVRFCNGSPDIIWYKNPITRYCYSNDGNANVNHPGLIFRYRNESIIVYAFKGNYSKNKILYKPEYPNVYNDNVCHGSIETKKFKSESVSDIINSWEGFFYDTKFSGQLWADALNGEKHPFKIKTGRLIDLLK